MFYALITDNLLGIIADDVSTVSGGVIEGACTIHAEKISLFVMEGEPSAHLWITSLIFIISLIENIFKNRRIGINLS